MNQEWDFQPSHLRGVIFADSPDDAELIRLQLLREHYELDWTRVDSEAEFLKSLESLPDLILVDSTLPLFGVQRDLQLIHARRLDIPVIVVTGSTDEETAYYGMEWGASDYVLKDRPARLGLEVRNALEQSDLRREHNLAQEKECQNVGEVAVLVNSADYLLGIKPLEEVYAFVEKTIFEYTGEIIMIFLRYGPETNQIMIHKITGPGEQMEKVLQMVSGNPYRMRFSQADMLDQELANFTSGRLIKVEDPLYWVSTREVPRRVCHQIEKLLDISEAFSIGYAWNGNLFGRKTLLHPGQEINNARFIEVLMRQASMVIQRILSEQAHSRSGAELTGLFDHSAIGIFRSTIDGRWVRANPSLARMLSYETPAGGGKDVKDIIHKVYLDHFDRIELMHPLEKEERIIFEDHLRRKNGEDWVANINIRTGYDKVRERSLVRTMGKSHWKMELSAGSLFNAFLIRTPPDSNPSSDPDY